MPRLRVELLGVASNRHTTLAILLLADHIEGESKRALPRTLSLVFQLLQLTQRQSSELEYRASCGRALSAVDVTTDHERKVLFLWVG